MADPYRTMPCPSSSPPPGTERYEANLYDISVRFYLVDSTGTHEVTFNGDNPPERPAVGIATYSRYQPPYLMNGDDKLHEFMNQSFKRGYLIFNHNVIVPWHRLASAHVFKRVDRPVSFLWRYEPKD